MSEDAYALQSIWMSETMRSEDDVRTAAGRVLDKDRAERRRERRMRGAGAAALVALVPVLIWAAAYGVSPLVRIAYALMAVGCVAGVSAEWLYLAWSRRALPGPDDTRSQLQRTAFMLESQMWLSRTAPLWSSPVFIGVTLICLWLYRERTLASALTVGVLGLAAWIGTGVGAVLATAELGRRRRRLDEALADLRG